MKFKIITPAEYNEYQKIIAEHGYHKTFFTLSEEKAYTKTSPANVVPLGGIIITCNKTRLAKTYPCIVGNPWIKEFENDLNNGFFKL